MIIKPSQRMAHLSPHFFASLNIRISEMQRDGIDVIRLDEGNPDLPPAPHIIEALSQSASSAKTHGYQPHRGPRALREAWAGMYERLYGVVIDPESEILPLLGSKEGIFHVIMAYIDPGDIVLIPDPGYITYTRSTLFAGGEPYYFPLPPERQHLPDLQSIPKNILKKARVLWLNYPNNPTSATATLEFFDEAVDFTREHNLLLCHDAAYTQVSFDGYQAPSLLRVPAAKEVGIEFNTLSKSHNMAGWRVGAAIGNPQVLRTLHTLKTNVDSSHYLPVMEAATVAMTGDQEWLATRNAVYRQRRDMILETLHSSGLKACTPQASLYIWCPVPHGWTTHDFTTSLLENAHISLTPGTLFGQNGEGFVRISLTAPVERISEAMQRFKFWMEQCHSAS